jgi:hypothetical protein
MEYRKKARMEKPESEMTLRGATAEGARLAHEVAKLRITAVHGWIEASKEVERVYDPAKQRQ